MKKGLLVGLAVVLLVSLGGLIGCGGGGIAGTYVLQPPPPGSSYVPTDYELQLHSDGHFDLIYEGQREFWGRWEVEGNKVICDPEHVVSGETFNFEIRGDQLIDSDGGLWAKQ